MRIPSQFNEDNLYRRGSPRAKSGNSTRQVVRMVVVLVLLIFVMQQAGQPRFYAVFFEDQSDAGPVSELGEDFDATLMATQFQRVKDLVATEPTRQIATALTRSLSLNQQRQWTAILSRWNSGKPFPLVGSVVEETRSLIDDLSEVDPDEQAAWSHTLDVFGEIYVESELVVGGEPRREKESTADNDNESALTPATVAELSDEDAVRLIAWFTALDRAALDRVVDGSVWRSPDFDAFYLQLDQARTLSSEGAVATAVVQLLQQPEIYRGQPVRLSGQIARAERMDATANPHSINNYWQLWIKPDTGSDRPIIVIAPDLTPQVTQLVQEGGHPRAKFVGRFFKRLAYRSQLGADLAPVVIGRMSIPPPTKMVATNSASRNQSLSDGQRFVLTLIAATVLGVSIAGYTMWRSSVSAKRHRDLRSRRQQPEFPGGLAEIDASDPAEQTDE